MRLPERRGRSRTERGTYSPLVPSQPYLLKPQTDDSLRWQLTGDDYSDGASIYQLLSRGPWGDFQRVVAVIGSSLVTPLRPRDYDIEAIQQVAQAITEGKQGLLLPL